MVNSINYARNQRPRMETPLSEEQSLFNVTIVSRTSCWFSQFLLRKDSRQK